MKPREVYDLARKHLGSGLSEPREIAGLMAAEIADDDLRDALGVALPAIVRRVIADQSARLTGTPRDNDRAPTDRPDPKHVQVAVAAGQWKQLGDCTRDELVAMAAHRRTIVAEHLALADQFDRLADAIATADVSTVSDLSVRVLTLVSTPDGRCAPSPGPPAVGPVAARSDRS